MSDANRRQMTPENLPSPHHGPRQSAGTALGSGSESWASGSAPIPMPTSGASEVGSGQEAQGLGPQPVHDPGSPLSAPALSAPAPSSSPTPQARAVFEAGELAIVCSRYDIGIIEAVKEFRRGSGRAPKVVLKTDRGRFLLKRRTAGKNTPGRVAFSHAIQSHLAQRRFPLPRLVATRTDSATMLVLGSHIYELFEFIPGNAYDGSLDATADAGRALGFFHRLLGSFDAHAAQSPAASAAPAPAAPPAGSYHAARGLAEHLNAIASRAAGPEEAAVVERLRAAYDEAGAAVDGFGFASWPVQIIHGDWHPGNMLFHGSRVGAVIDYDTARRGPRALDLANGALQFSISMKGNDPLQWPEGLDETRLKRFCRGYESVKDCVISTAELAALPWLMIEALIVEAAVPIAATGGFAGLSGAAFLRMVDTKSLWLKENAARLTALLG